MIEKFKNPSIKFVNEKIRIPGKLKALICDCCELELPISDVIDVSQYDGIAWNPDADELKFSWKFATSPHSDHVLVFCSECAKAISRRMLELDTDELGRETFH